MPRALFAVLCLCCLATGKVTGPNKKHGGSQDEDPTLRLARAVAAAVVQELNRQQPQALPPPAPMLPMLPPQPMAPWPGYPGPMMMIGGGGPMLQPMMGWPMLQQPMMNQMVPWLQLKCTKKNCGCYSWPCLNFSQVPLPNGATLTIASPEPVPGGATHGPGSLPSGPSTSSLSASPTSSLASSPAAGPESGKKRMCLSDLDGLSAAAKEEGWRHLTQSAKRKARKVNYEGWWDDKEKKKDEKDDTQEKADLHPDTSNDSWNPKWPGFGPPKPDGGGLAA